MHGPTYFIFSRKNASQWRSCIRNGCCGEELLALFACFTLFDVQHIIVLELIYGDNLMMYLLFSYSILEIAGNCH